ncbi:MAG: type II secretion system F family protein [Armatimonadetes bacterium]|nr:type II secretion system F family protein [Armatimonadota bacterium]
MTTYAYVALEPSGKKKTGFVDAPTRDQAIEIVSRDGRYVVEIKEQERRRKMEGDGRRRGKVGPSEIALFTRRLADLSSAGLPLDRALQVVAEQSESGTLADVANQALEDVRGGLPVSDALAKHERMFPGVYTQTLRAGEASGQFASVAERLADFLENQVARRSQIVSAMVYPIVLTVTSFGVVLFLMTFVMPRLEGVFHDLGGTLPPSTQMLMGFSRFLTQNGLVLLGLAVAGVIGFRAWVKTDGGALARDNALMKTPLVGPIVTKATVSRFARILSTLVYGGVPILEAIRLAGMASGNRVFLVKAETVEQEVREGRAIAEAMRDTGAFPPVLTHMVAIGEQTGDLPKMLTRVSDSLDFEVDNSLRRLTALVEPAIVLLLGTIVGFVVISVLLPILSAQELVK